MSGETSTGCQRRVILIGRPDSLALRAEVEFRW